MSKEKIIQSEEVSSSPRVGLAVKHYSNSFQNSTFHHQMTSDFGKTNTDKSTFRPDISIVRAQQSALSGKKLLYDFPDGKDTGNYVMTYVRDKGLDVTEVDSALEQIKSSIDEKISSSNEKDELLESVKQIADSLKKDSPQVDDSAQDSKS